MSKRIRIFTVEDLADHASSASCWVSRDGKVYDVTEFLDGELFGLTTTIFGLIADPS